MENTIFLQHSNPMDRIWRVDKFNAEDDWLMPMFDYCQNLLFRNKGEVMVWFRDHLVHNILSTKFIPKRVRLNLMFSNPNNTTDEETIIVTHPKTLDGFTLYIDMGDDKRYTINKDPAKYSNVFPLRVEYYKDLDWCNPNVVFTKEEQDSMDIDPAVYTQTVRLARLHDPDDPITAHAMASFTEGPEWIGYKADEAEQLKYLNDGIEI